MTNLSEEEISILAEKDAKAFEQWKKDGKLPEGWQRTKYGFRKVQKPISIQKKIRMFFTYWVVGIALSGLAILTWGWIRSMWIMVGPESQMAIIVILAAVGSFYYVKFETAVDEVDVF